MIALLAGLAVTLEATAQTSAPAAPPAAASPVAQPPAAPESDLDPGIPVTNPYEGRPVSSIRLEGLTRVKEPFIRNQLRTAEGRPLEWDLVREDCRRLQRLGEFRGVAADVEVQADLSVVVVYKLTEAPIVKDVQVVGNREIPDEDIIRVTSEIVALIRGVPIDDYRVAQGQRAIENLYREKGYYQVQVIVDESELAGDGTIQYVVREGERTRVTVIRFEGNNSIESRKLRPELKTEEANWFVTAPLDEEVLDRDVAAIVKFYQDRGYLDVRVGRRVQPSPDSKEAIVTFIVEEGTRYTLGTLEIKGRPLPNGDPGMLTVFTPEQLAGVVELKPGGVFGRKDVDAAVEAVKNAYLKLGYVDVQVGSEELRSGEGGPTPDGTGPRVDLRLFVREGERFKTGLVVIQGNTLTQSKVIRREVTVKPDRWLDGTEAQNTERRLRNSGLFETNPQNGPPPKVTVQPEDPENPGFRDVLVEVTETDTGSINFGAAVSSDASVFGVININQRNFDLADTPDSFGEFITGKAFRGAGQNFNLSLQPGLEQSSYSLTIGEPSFLESPYAVSNTIAFTDREYNEYDEQRISERFRIGRRFGERWAGSLAFRVQAIEITDIESDSPVDVFEVEGDNFLTGLGFELTRTTVDNRIRPTEGTRTELGVEQIGVFGGDFDFTRFTAEHTFFLPIDEDYLGRKTVLSVKTRGGYLVPEGDAPIFERFFMGGRNFRGFEFRGIGPLGIRNDTQQLGDEHVGGDFSFFLGPEIEKPIFQDVIAVVVFADTGTLNKDFSFDQYRVTVGAGVRLYVPAFGSAPLAFDFAVPVVDFEGDEDQLFSFAIDIPF
ncbi:MAG: outer membrane protein assembly factor BamA [Phycisphaerales bacterium]